MEKHISVLLKETIDSLNIKENGIYVDSTLGFAGHSSEILKRIPNGKLYAFDKDETAISYSNERLNKISNNFKLYNEGFENIKEVSVVTHAVSYDYGKPEKLFWRKYNGKE